MNLEEMGEQGFRTYNNLREFYNKSDRIELLHYVVDYAEVEAAEKQVPFEGLVRKIGYETMKDLYDRNMQNLREGQDVVPLELGLKRFLLELRKEGAFK